MKFSANRLTILTIPSCEPSLTENSSWWAWPWNLLIIFFSKKLMIKRYQIPVGVCCEHSPVYCIDFIRPSVVNCEGVWPCRKCTTFIDYSLGRYEVSINETGLHGVWGRSSLIVNYKTEEKSINFSNFWMIVYFRFRSRFIALRRPRNQLFEADDHKQVTSGISFELL